MRFSLRKNRLNDWFGNYEKHRIVQDFLDDFLYDRFYWLLKVSRLATYIYKCTILMCLLKSNAFVMTEKYILIGCVVSLSSSICFCQTQSDLVAEWEVTAHFSWANVLINYAQTNISFSLIHPLTHSAHSLHTAAKTLRVEAKPFISWQHVSPVEGEQWSEWRSAAGTKHFSWLVLHHSATASISEIHFQDIFKI